MNSGTYTHSLVCSKDTNSGKTIELRLYIDILEPQCAELAVNEICDHGGPSSGSIFKIADAKKAIKKYHNTY